MSLTLVLLVVLVALVFEYINGFHDTANSIATVVATKVLSPGQAVLLAAATNLLGALWGTAVAKTISSGLIDSGVVAVTPQVLICALLGATIWDLITWWRGLPSSSSHALVGGLCGASLAAAGNNWSALIWWQGGVHWWEGKGLLPKVVLPMVTSPILGFLIGYLLMGALFALIAFLGSRRGPVQKLGRPRFVNAFFGKAQLVSASAMGLSHGTNDAQKTMGIIALALATATTAGSLDQLPSWLSFLRVGEDADKQFEIAAWIKVTCAVVMAAGTAAGGWRIIKTLGHKTGEAASDQRLRGGDIIRDRDPVGIAVRHPGFDDAQHFRRDHGRRRGQARQRDQVDRGRAHGLGVDPDAPGRGIARVGVGCRAASHGRGLNRTLSVSRLRERRGEGHEVRRSSHARGKA